MLKTLFTRMSAERGYTPDRIYPIAGGECALRPDGTEALVRLDGRFPAAEKGASLNRVCTETVRILTGACVADLDGELRILHEGDELAIRPGTRYSLAGKCLSEVRIDPPWDASQNTTVTDDHAA